MFIHTYIHSAHLPSSTNPVDFLLMKLFMMLSFSIFDSLTRSLSLLLASINDYSYVNMFVKCILLNEICYVICYICVHLTFIRFE